MSEYRAEFGDPASIDSDTLVAKARWEELRSVTASILGKVGVAGVQSVSFVRGAAETFIFNPGIGASMPDWVLGSHIAYRACVPLEAHARKLINFASNMGFQPPASVASPQYESANDTTLGTDIIQDTDV